MAKSSNREEIVTKQIIDETKRVLPAKTPVLVSKWLSKVLSPRIDDNSHALRWTLCKIQRIVNSRPERHEYISDNLAVAVKKVNSGKDIVPAVRFPVEHTDYA